MVSNREKANEGAEKSFHRKSRRGQRSVGAKRGGKPLLAKADRPNTINSNRQLQKKLRVYDFWSKRVNDLKEKIVGRTKRVWFDEAFTRTGSRYLLATPHFFHIKRRYLYLKAKMKRACPVLAGVLSTSFTEYLKSVTKDRRLDDTEDLGLLPLLRHLARGVLSTSPYRGKLPPVQPTRSRLAVCNCTRVHAWCSECGGCVRRYFEYASQTPPCCANDPRRYHYASSARPQRRSKPWDGVGKLTRPVNPEPQVDKPKYPPSEGPSFRDLF